jgi:ribokinase
MRFYRNDPKEMPNKMGMGDAFTSGFAVAYCHGNEIDDCVKFGNDVSLKVSKNEAHKMVCLILKILNFKKVIILRLILHF